MDRAHQRRACCRSRSGPCDSCGCPEISGTRAYLKAHPGSGGSTSSRRSRPTWSARTRRINHNSLHLNQTMYSIPSVLNDVSRQFFEYVGETNREKLHNRRIAYAFSNPIVDPSGTHDPFWYHIEKFYGAERSPGAPRLGSAHSRGAVRQLARRRLPLERRLAGEPGPDADEARGVPDGDRRQRRSPMRAPPTPSPSARSRSATRSSASPPTSGTRSLSISTSTADTLNQNYKEALNVVSAGLRARARRRAFGDDAGDRRQGRGGEHHVAGAGPWTSEPLDTARVKTATSWRRRRLKVPVVEDAGADRRREGGGAADSIEEAWRRRRRRSGRGMRTGRAAAAAGGLLRDGSAQLRRRQHSILDIRNAIAAEFGPVALGDVVQFFRDAEKAGTFTIAEKPAEPVGKKKNEVAGAGGRQLTAACWPLRMKEVPAAGRCAAGPQPVASCCSRPGAMGQPASAAAP